MPYKDKERQRQYLREYRKKNRKQLLARRRKLYRQQHPPTNWSIGHSDIRICVNCGGKSDNKPLESCTEPRHQAHYLRRKERHNAYRRRKRKEAKERGEVWGWQENPRKRAERERQIYHELRQAVFDRLGYQCTWCGFKDERALQIDHIRGDGALERNKKNLTGTKFSRHLLSLSDLELHGRYQILCANCNCIKRCKNEER